MKTTLFALFCLFSAAVVHGQKDSAGLYFGINAAKMLQMLGDNPNNNQYNPYLAELGFSTSKFGFHTGIGLNKNATTHQPSSANGHVTTQQDSSSADWRIGGYYKLAINGRWGLNIGLDYYQSKYDKSLNTKFTNEIGESVEDDKISTFKESGVSPTLTVQYKPHPKVSIGTELLFRMGKHTLTETATSNLFPEFDSELITEGNRSYFIAPSALFICLTL